MALLEHCTLEPKKTVVGKKKLISLAAAACMGIAGTMFLAGSRNQDELTNVEMPGTQVVVQTPQCTLSNSQSGNAPRISFVAPAHNLGAWHGNVNGNLEIAATGTDGYCTTGVEMGGETLSQPTWFDRPCDGGYSGIPCVDTFNHAASITVAINQCPGVANAGSSNYPVISAVLSGASWHTADLTGTVHIANSGTDAYCVESVTVNDVVVMNGRFWIDWCDPNTNWQCDQWPSVTIRISESTWVLALQHQLSSLNYPAPCTPGDTPNLQGQYVQHVGSLGETASGC